MWYKETDYQGINADNRSLTIAFANLLKKMDSDYQPLPNDLFELLTSDDPNIDWWSVAEYVEDMEIKEVRAEETEWPPVSNAIVKFRRMDEKVAGPVDHFCLVADHRARSIVDSLDGVIKSSAAYGEIIGWASYVGINPDPELDAKEAKILADSGADEPNVYVLHQGENIWDAARKLHFKVDELLKLNEIDDPRQPKAGTKLHLPIRETEEKRPIRYEILPEPVPMHVSKSGGAVKYSFGNASKWSHLGEAGRNHAENSNQMIVAIAHVELKEEGTTAAYYMDRIDLGNYHITGRPQFTTGFNHSHLAEGHVMPGELTAPKADVIEAMGQVETALAEAQITKPRTMDIQVNPASPAPSHAVVEDYHTTLVAIKSDETPVQFMAEETIAVHEIGRRRPARPLNKGQSVKISHTFEKDNILYGLPAGTKNSPFWFGIPMDKVISEEELYNFNIPLNERIALRGRLTTQERGVVVLSKVMSQGTKIRIWLKNKKQGEK